MAFNVTLQPSGLQFAAAEDSTILDAAEKAGIALPASCCFAWLNPAPMP